MDRKNINALLGIDLTQISQPNFRTLISDKLPSEEPLDLLELLKVSYEEKAWANFVTEIIENEFITRLPRDRFTQLQNNLNKEGSKEKAAFQRVKYGRQNLLCDIINLYIQGFPVSFYEKCIDRVIQSNVGCFTQGLLEIVPWFIGSYFPDRKITPEKGQALENFFNDQRLSLISKASEPVYFAAALKEFLQHGVDINELGQDYEHDLARLKYPNLFAQNKVRELKTTGSTQPMNPKENALEITSSSPGP